MIKNIRQIIREEISNLISEIGEGSFNPYPYTLERESETFYGKLYTYTFKLDDQPGYTGKVRLMHGDESRFPRFPESRGELEIDFDILDAYQTHTNDISYDSTNLGLKSMFRIMSTVVDIIKNDLIDRITLPIETIALSTVSAKSSRLKTSNKGSEQRIKLYDAFIRKHLDIKNTVKIDDIARGYELKNPILPKNKNMDS
jgi:hypothetical protein